MKTKTKTNMREYLLVSQFTEGTIKHVLGLNICCNSDFSKNNKKLRERAGKSFKAGVYWRNDQLRSSSFINLIYDIANNNTLEEFKEYLKTELKNFK